MFTLKATRGYSILNGFVFRWEHRFGLFLENPVIIGVKLWDF